MSEEKRPVLSLKRKPATDNAGANNNTGTPDVVVRRKKVVVVSTRPPGRSSLRKRPLKPQRENCAGHGQSLKGTASGPVSPLTASGTGHHDSEGILATVVRR
jgi:hypothetical protein